MDRSVFESIIDKIDERIEELKMELEEAKKTNISYRVSSLENRISDLEEERIRFTKEYLPGIIIEELNESYKKNVNPIKRLLLSSYKPKYEELKFLDLEEIDELKSSIEYKKKREKISAKDRLIQINTRINNAINLHEDNTKVKRIV